jgi:hypothetical protein
VPALGYHDVDLQPVVLGQQPPTGLVERDPDVLLGRVPSIVGAFVFTGGLPAISVVVVAELFSGWGSIGDALTLAWLLTFAACPG